VYDQDNLLSWTFTNYCRVQNQSSSWTSGQQCTSGGIIAYFGIFLALGKSVAKKRAGICITC